MLVKKISKITKRLLAAVSSAVFFISSAVADTVTPAANSGSGGSTGSTTFNPIELLWSFVYLFLEIAYPIGVIMALVAILMIAKGWKQKVQHDMDAGLDMAVAAALVIGMRWVLSFLGISV